MKNDESQKASNPQLGFPPRFRGRLFFVHRILIITRVKCVTSYKNDYILSYDLQQKMVLI